MAYMVGQHGAGFGFSQPEERLGETWAGFGQILSPAPILILGRVTRHGVAVSPGQARARVLQLLDVAEHPIAMDPPSPFADIGAGGLYAIRFQFDSTLVPATALVRISARLASDPPVQTRVQFITLPRAVEDPDAIFKALKISAGAREAFRGTFRRTFDALVAAARASPQQTLRIALVNVDVGGGTLVRCMPTGCS
jgi:hypothetical protein